MRALAGTGVPVPKTLLYCDDETVLGTAFFVVDHVAGRTFWDPELPDLSPERRSDVYDDMIRVLALLHAVDPAAAGLQDFGRPGNYFARQIGRWSRQYRASETEPIEAMDNLIDWLPEHIPDGNETSIVHGDYRLDNLIFDPVEARVVAVIDWELSTLGHPLADLAYHVMSWRTPADLRGLAGRDLASLGIPPEGDYVRKYLAHAGRQPFGRAAWEFAIAYNLFRVAALRQGVMRRGLDGNAASERAIEAGARARQAAQLGWRIAQQIEGGSSLV
jgi:aminoglycoside phosphotransferase (APT) family kinase protein